MIRLRGSEVVKQNCMVHGDFDLGTGEYEACPKCMEKIDMGHYACTECDGYPNCYEDCTKMVVKPHSLTTQVGGGHYKDKAIQPVEYCMANNIPFMEGCVIKYCTRWRDKGGVQDLEKARHFLDMLIEYEKGRG